MMTVEEEPLTPRLRMTIESHGILNNTIDVIHSNTAATKSWDTKNPNLGFKAEQTIVMQMGKTSISHAKEKRRQINLCTFESS